MEEHGHTCKLLMGCPAGWTESGLDINTPKVTGHMENTPRAPRSVHSGCHRVESIERGSKMQFYSEAAFPLLYPPNARTQGPVCPQ